MVTEQNDAKVIATIAAVLLGSVAESTNADDNAHNEQQAIARARRLLQQAQQEQAEQQEMLVVNKGQVKGHAEQ